MKWVKTILGALIAVIVSFLVSDMVTNFYITKQVFIIGMERNDLDAVLMEGFVKTPFSTWVCIKIFFVKTPLFLLLTYIGFRLIHPSHLMWSSIIILLLTVFYMGGAIPTDILKYPVHRWIRITAYGLSIMGVAFFWWHFRKKAKLIESGVENINPFMQKIKEKIKDLTSEFDD